jgi:integrase
MADSLQISSPTAPRTARRNAPPAYRQRPGYDQAIVTLSDAFTKKRRDYWLGEFGSSSSRELYHRVIAQWEASERRLPPPVEARVTAANTASSASSDVGAITIDEIVRDYWRWARSYYSTSECSTIRSALRVLRKLFGSLPAADFGPSRLRLVRDDMVRGDPTGKHPRQPWSRRHANGQVHRICAVFKWAAAHELLPAAVHLQLKTLPSLKRGRTTAKETPPVGPVSLEHVAAVRPFLSRQVNALIDLQIHTGARGGELLKLRPVDIIMDERSGIWRVSPQEHKTAHHGHARTIFLGPKAQAVVLPFLAGRAIDAFLFNPIEAEEERLAAREAERKTPRTCGNTRGSNRVPQRRRPPGDHYTPAAYRRAIARACDEAFPHPDKELHPKPRDPSSNEGAGHRGDRGIETRKELAKRLTPDQRAELARWRAEHRWHPHQLRHTTATLIRREFGLEAARIALGHSSAAVTDAVYAQRDMDRVVEVMRKLG